MPAIPAGLRAQKRRPRLGRAIGCGVDTRVLEGRPHGRRGDGDAESGEFSVDAAISPRRVLASEADDDLSGFACGGWPARPIRVGPVVRYETSVPNQGSCRASRGRSTSGPYRASGPTTRRGPHGRSKRGRGTWRWRNRELVSQHEDRQLRRGGPKLRSVRWSTAEWFRALWGGHGPSYEVVSGLRLRRAHQRPGRRSGTTSRTPRRSWCAIPTGVVTRRLGSTATRR